MPQTGSSSWSHQNTSRWIRDLFNRVARTAAAIAMLPLLLALGATGAVLELRRLVSRGHELPTDVQSLQESELKLKQLLQADLLFPVAPFAPYISAFILCMTAGSAVPTYCICTYCSCCSLDSNCGPAKQVRSDSFGYRRQISNPRRTYIAKAARHVASLS